MKKSKLVLKPSDYIVFAEGLKIENIGNKVIEVELPSEYKVSPYKEILKEVLND